MGLFTDLDGKVAALIRFTVYGTAQPQGSSRAFVPKGWTRAVITSSNPKLKSWRQEFAKAAMLACKDHDCPVPRNVAMAVIIGFYFAKPKSTKKSVQHKVTKPDVDKLLRAALDGMTGIVYHDDSQVTDARVKKFFGLPERAEIAVGLAE